MSVLYKRENIYTFVQVLCGKATFGTGEKFIFKRYFDVEGLVMDTIIIELQIVVVKI